MRRYIVPLLLSLSLSCTSGANLVEPETGEIAITVTTTGTLKDADGYTVTLNGEQPQFFGVDATSTFSLAVGTYTLRLHDMAANCTVQGQNPWTVVITEGETTPFTFAVSCLRPGNHTPEPFERPFESPVVVMNQVYNDNVNAVDEDDDPITFALITQPQHGTITFRPDGSFTYTPTPNYTGGDSFTFTASDGSATSDPYPHVFFVNATPVARPDTFRVPMNTEMTVFAPGVLVNDYDLNLSEQLAALIYLFPNGEIDYENASPQHGTLSNVGGDGGFTYTPNPGFVGIDKFKYRASETSSNRPLESTLTEVVIVVE